jgi:hypothetical protein
MDIEFKAIYYFFKLKMCETVFYNKFPLNKNLFFRKITIGVVLMKRYFFSLLFDNIRNTVIVYEIKQNNDVPSIKRFN